VCEEHVCQGIDICYSCEKPKGIGDWGTFETFVMHDEVIHCCVCGCSQLFFQEVQQDFISLVHFCRQNGVKPRIMFFVGWKMEQVFLHICIHCLPKCKVHKWVVPLDHGQPIFQCMKFCCCILIAEYFSWMDWLQKTKRLNLFDLFSNFVDLMVVVRVPGGAPFVVPVFCCMLATVARTVLEISCSQLGSSSDGIALVKFWPTCGFGGITVCVGVCIPTV